MDEKKKQEFPQDSEKGDRSEPHLVWRRAKPGRMAEMVF